MWRPGRSGWSLRSARVMKAEKTPNNKSAGGGPSGQQDLSRQSGIKSLGPLRWGAHVCLFYESKSDLLELLVPYFAAGLKNNEFCLWITAAPLGTEEAGRALAAVVPDLAERKARGQLEIIPYDRWYTASGRFDANKALEKCVETEARSLGGGYAGLRVTGNASWLDDGSRDSFLGYERAVDEVIGEHRVLAFCAYPLKKCLLPDLVEVLDTHEYALARSRGAWRKIAGGRRRTESALCETETMYRAFFRQIHDSILLLEMDPPGAPVIRDVNAMAEKTFGYSREELVGRPVSLLNADKKAVRAIAAKGGSGDGFSFIVRHRRKDGTVFTAEASAQELAIGGKRMAISVERDISGRLKAQEALRRTCTALEVEKRRLEEKNIAFREAMNAVEAEKNKMKDEAIVNVNKIVLPIVKRIRLKGGASRELLDLLEKSLGALVSSFGRRLTESSLKLTPKEMEVANMVKSGLTTKEISGLLNASRQTVDKHRNNIRRKLGLANQGVNLVSYLRDL